MDSILQEISKEDALRRYLDGEDIQVLRPTQSGRLAMWSLNELFQGSRFLVNSCKETEYVTMPMEIVPVGDPGFTNIIMICLNHLLTLLQAYQMKIFILR